jgi:ankyrin repeat protein
MMKETPLHWAVDWLSLPAVQVLLQRNANVHLLDVYKNSPLHKISGDCDQKVVCRDIVALLVKHGSDITLRNEYNRTPLQHFDTTANDAAGANENSNNNNDHIIETAN